MRIIFVALLALMAALPAMGDALAKEVPSSQAQIQLSFAPVVKDVAPAVVNIYTRRVVAERSGFRSPLFNDPFFRRFFGDNFAAPGRSRKRVQSSLGSGVIVRDGGVIVTNHHVIKGADQITVALADRREFDAEVLLTDDRTDLAILKIDTKGEKLPFVPFRDSDGLEVGDLVLAIGNPFGVGQTVTSGIVSALARTQIGVSDYSFFIQTDAAINPGNSGGALVAMDGQLVGINTAIYSKSGGSVGIGFAIPANMVQSVVTAALEDGVLRRPWFGASGQTVTSEIADSLDLDRPGGVLIDRVYPDGPADDAGLEPGDIVTAVNGQEVLDPDGLNYRLAAAGDVKAVDLKITRSGRNLTRALALRPAPDSPDRDMQLLDGRHPLSGAVIGNVNPAFAIELGVDPQLSGVIVAKVRRGSIAARIGLRPNDLVRGLNGVEIMSAANVANLLEQTKPPYELTIERNGRLITQTFK